MKDGIFSKYDMIDKVIVLLNSVSVEGAKNVLAMSNVFQILSTMKKGLKDEDNAKNNTIELLKEQLKRANEPDSGGEIIGGEHIDLKFGGDDNGNG